MRIQAFRESDLMHCSGIRKQVYRELELQLHAFSLGCLDWLQFE